MNKEVVITKCKHGFVIHEIEEGQNSLNFAAKDAHAFSALEGRYGHETDCVLGFLREYFKDEDPAE